ncbi:MAG: S41 family peptidase [Clostridia bacterium]|nr:S41 family peptidase [Clostridia bacterium]
MKYLSKNVVAVFSVIVSLLIVISLTIGITLSMTRIDASANEIRVGGDKEYQKRYERLDEIYKILMRDYYKEVDSETLIQGAIDGMLASLNDPYTFYYTPEQMAESMENHAGKYSGIGILVSSNKEGRLSVNRVFKDSPAMAAGLLAGDVITHVDGIEVNARTTEDLNNAVALVKGEDGTTVEITVSRKGSNMTLTVSRGKVKINRVEYYIFDDVGYIILYEFLGDAVNGVKEALRAFNDADVKGLIFDVRSNTGGELYTCLNITDLMIPEGLIMYTEDRNGDRQSHYSNEYAYGLPMVVLVNEMTASASEVFTAAVQDYDMGVIMGTNTFGKGIVQQVRTFPTDGAGMQLTVEAYYTPSGRNIHEVGIQPDIVVELSENYDPSIYTPDMENDNQLKAAYDEVRKMIDEKAN